MSARRMLVRSLKVPRLAALASLALLLACAGQRGSGREGPGDAGASKAAGSSDRAGAAEQPTSEGDERPPVDVVALDPGDARPCERMCGRIGDCMRTEEGTDPADATGVEFACLDTCVYAEPLHAATTEFQACDQASACGELLGCARSRWDAVTAARREVKFPTQFTAVRDTCESTCMAFQSCNYFYRMPDQLGNLGTPDFYSQVEMCTEGCRSSGDQYYAAFAECTNESDCDQFWACTSRAYAYP